MAGAVLEKSAPASYLYIAIYTTNIDFSIDIDKKKLFSYNISVNRQFRYNSSFY